MERSIGGLELQGGFGVQRDKVSLCADSGLVWTRIKFVIKKEWQLP